jgi:hypothetical protein
MKKLVLENFLPYRLNRPASALSQDFTVVYGRHYDLTAPEWRVLATRRPRSSPMRSDSRNWNTGAGV